MITGFYLAPKSEQVERLTDVGRITELYRAREGTLWVDFEEPTPAETDRLEPDFELHPLAVEMCREVTSQPLIHDYDQYLFMVIHAVNFAAEEEVGTLELDMRWGRHLVLTYHREPIRAVTYFKERIAQSGGPLLARGPDFLVHAIVDRIIDNFQPTLERIDDVIDAAEDRIFVDPDDTVLQHVMDLKRSAAYLYRVATSQRDVVGRIIRGEFPQIGKQALTYWRDAYDHLVRMVQAVESQRDLIAGVRDMYLSVVSNRMNEIMKVLTIIATIFIPITFIAGVYGMNFKWMPELGVWWGYPAVLGVMATVAGGMLLYFRSKRWL